MVFTASKDVVGDREGVADRGVDDREGSQECVGEEGGRGIARQAH